MTKFSLRLVYAVRADDEPRPNPRSGRAAQPVWSPVSNRSPRTSPHGLPDRQAARPRSTARRDFAPRSPLCYLGLGVAEELPQDDGAHGAPGIRYTVLRKGPAPGSMRAGEKRQGHGLT